ncbi:MAG: DUF1572 family protein [Candidatus Eisenbacteria bacterium]
MNRQDPGGELGTHLLADAIARFHELKRLGDGALAQVDDAAFFARLDPDANAMAHVVKHVAGNLRSRWRNLLTEDGEKPDRDRDREFELDPAADTRDALMARWEEGWAILFAELGALGGSDLLRTVTIRHEPHSVVQCIQRQLGHYGYHVGQIVLLARHARGAAWATLSVPRRGSGEFNATMKKKFSG